MPDLNEEILLFFKKQDFVIVSTIDYNGRINNSCKSIVKIDKAGRVYLLDLYLRRTFENLKNNTHISITAADGHSFQGYCLKGKARVVEIKQLPENITRIWDEKVNARISQRIIKNIREEKSPGLHPEAAFPRPQYMIVMDVEETVDLTPRHLK